MITLEQQPAEIELNRNPVLLKVKATDATGKVYGPVAASARLTLTANSFADGDQIVVKWTDAEGGENFLAFTALDTLLTEFTISARPTAMSTADYIALIVPQFQAHPVVGSLFEIVGSTTYIDFIALEKVDGWIVGFDLTGLDATFVSSAFVADDTPSLYRILLDVFVEQGYNSNTFSKMLQAQTLPNEEGICTFQIQDILYSAYRNSRSNPGVPTWGTAEIIPAETLRKYSLRYREDYQDIYTTNPVDGQWQALPPKIAITGGVSQALFPTANFLDAIDASNSLFHWYPSGKTVGRDQPEYLAWYNYFSTEKDVEIELTTWNETTEAAPTYPYSAAKKTVQPGDVVLIPIGPDILSLATDVRKYKVSVGFKGTDALPGEEPPYDQYSPGRIYYIDLDSHKEVKYLQYLNGFGIPETIRCIGNFSREVEISRSVFEKVLQPDYTPTTAELEQYDQAWQNIFTYRTGFLSKEEVDALQELVIWSEVYEVSEGGYIPLQISGKKYDLHETNQSLHALEFVTTPKLRPRNYSNNNINIDPTGSGWLMSSSGYWLGLVGKPWTIQ